MDLLDVHLGHACNVLETWNELRDGHLASERVGGIAFAVEKD